MEDLERVANLCSINATDNYPGAGANAISRVVGTFATTSIFEVVWSPRKGLSLKCPDSRLTEKKAPVLWSTELFIMKTDPGGFCSGGNSSSVHLQPNSEDKIHHEVTSLGSPHNITSMMHCSVESHEYSPGINQQGDTPSVNKDGDTSVGIDHLIDNNSWENVVVASAGQQDGKIGDCLFHEPEELMSNLAQEIADPSDSNEQLLREDNGRDPEVNGNQHSAKSEELVYDNPLFNKQNCPEDLAYERCKDVKESEPGHIASENYKSGATHFIYLHPPAEHCTLTSDLNDALGSQLSSLNCLIEAKNEHYNQDMVVKTDLSNEARGRISSICEKEKSHFVEPLSNDNANALNHCNGEESISIKGKTRSISNEKDDSSDSVGSINSKQPFVTGKRVMSFGEEMLMGSKRMKKSSDRSSSSGTHFRQGSSFMNWVSSVTKCHFRSGNMETQSLALVNRQKDVFSTTMSDNSNNDAAYRSVGFGSICKALYYPRLKGKSKAVSVVHPGDSGSSKGLLFENKISASNTDRMFNDDKQIRLHKPVPISSVRIEQGVCHLGEPPIQEKVKQDIREHCDLHTVGFSASHIQNASSSPSEGKEAGKLCPFIPYKSSDSSCMKTACRIPESVWITRFSPKAAAPMKSTTECNRGTLLKAEKSDDRNILLNHSQTDRDSIRDCSNTEDYHQCPLDNQRYNSEHLQQYSTSTMRLHCSEKVHHCLIAKSNFNPVLPSHELKRLDPITSVFAKRLDAFRHIQTSEAADNVTLKNPACLFCGHGGHMIMSCSDVVESELKDLLKNISSLRKIETQARLCIRCFQDDHWAVACPYTSLSSHDDGDASMTSPEKFLRTTNEGSDCLLLSNHVIRDCKKDEDRQCQLLRSAHRIPCGDMPRNITEFMLQTNINADMKSAMKEKQIASTSGGTELGDKSFLNIQNLITRKKPDEEAKIFERIRKLRLSRTDVIRWMELSTCPFNLDGFFLRVRLGKWEEGLGGACYHVACISGTSGNKLCGGHQSRFPVLIGASKCLIDCRFISNHDFVEDELKAWWCATLRGGGELPSEEDLDDKLRKGEKLGLLSGVGS